MSERNIMPEGLVNRLDIVRGVGDLALDGLKSLLHHLRPGMSGEPFASHGRHTFDANHETPDPEDTLASEPQLYVPQWVKDLPPMVYGDPLTHVQEMSNRWDAEGDYSDRSA